jgi:hypothetical protein
MKDSFCSSPWFHIGINPAGYFLPCRWPELIHNDLIHNIADTSLQDFMNSETMRNLRVELLNGNKPSICSACYYEDKHNKVSGRQRQLLKSAIKLNSFDKSFCSSPHYNLFEYSYNNNGSTDYTPVDIQIELGNTCNSSCIMCSPIYSSKLATDYQKLHTIEPRLFEEHTPFKNWADNPVLLDKFINDLIKLPNIKYIHFLGGETLYLKGFYEICNRLIDAGIAKDIMIGTTTNGTIYTPALENIIKQFKNVHLGISIETFTPLNNYVRYPSKISDIQANISKFLALREQTELHITLRITPTIFTIFHLDTVFEFMIDNAVTAESCNILWEPSCLRIELLPTDLINKTLAKLNDIIEKYQIVSNDELIINRRRDDLVVPVMSDLIFEYKRFLETYTIPTNIEDERYDLVKFTKAFESLRHNCILDYLPEYEEFLRIYGY